MRKTCLVLLLLPTLGLGCSWKRCAYEGGGRDAWQQPARVIEALGLEPGQSVADLGSGTGYFTGRLARAVEPGGTVFAVDVDADVHEELRERLAEEHVANVELVLATPDDPGLPDGRIDLVLTVDTYHHIGDRAAYFRRLKQDLAPDGRVAVIEFDGRKGTFVKLSGHYTEKSLILEEMAEAGYRVDEDFGFLDRQSFVVFAPDPPASGGLGRSVQEDLAHRPLAVVEDVIELAPHDRPHQLAERRQGQGPIDLIPHLGSALHLAEAVAMHPEPIRTAHLAIDEADVGLPGVDARAPTEGNPEQAQAVLDQRAVAHLDRERRQELEAQPRRRDAAQVARVGEEREHLGTRQREHAAPLQGVDHLRASRAAW